MRMKLNIDILGYICVALFTIAYLFSLDMNGRDIWVVGTFILIGLVSFTFVIIEKANISIRRCWYIFAYIFFFMAPLQQYCSGVVLWSTTGLSVSYNNSDYILANSIILLSFFCFEVGYQNKKRFVFNRHIYIVQSEIKMEKESNLQNRGDRVYLVLLLVSIISFSILYAFPGFFRSNTPLASQLSNIFRYFPVCSLLVYLMNYKSGRSRRNNFFLIVIVVEVIILFFPFSGNMARFILLGTYLTFYTYYFSIAKHRSIFFLVMVVAFSVLFSSMRFMNSVEVLVRPGKINFIHVDFDAYQFIMMSIRYVHEKGMVLGMNIISALAFLLPRSIWKGKMEGSGSILVSGFNSWQKNVSMPLIAEFYFAFGLLGVIALCFIFGKLSKDIDTWRNSPNNCKHGVFCICTGMSIYIFRGSLLAAFSFTAGLVLSMLFIYWISEKIKG